MEITISLDQREEQMIDSNLIGKITEKIVSEMNAKTIKTISDAAANKINFGIDQLLENTLIDFMDRKILITDKWGDKQEEYENVEEILKEKFDNFITELVDSKGKKKTSCSYREDVRTRLQYMIENKLQRYEKSFEVIIDKAVGEITKKIERKLKDEYDEKLKTKVAEQIFSKIKL